jgi:hypothetical protein
LRKLPMYSPENVAHRKSRAAHPARIQVRE